MLTLGAQVEVIDPVEDYLALLQKVFDFEMLRNFIARPDFSLVFDALHAVTGAYAGPILVEKLGARQSAVRCAAALQCRNLDTSLRCTGGGLAMEAAHPCCTDLYVYMRTQLRCRLCCAGMAFHWKILGADTQIQI